MKIRKGQIEVGRFLVPYRIYGDHGETIVCISGAQQTMAAWRSWVSYFSKEYIVVIFDQPGQRKGAILSGYDSISLDEQIEILHRIILRSGDTKRINLAGSSWGAIIAAAFASRYPENVDKIILGSFGVKPSKRLLAPGGRKCSHLVLLYGSVQVKSGDEDESVVGIVSACMLLPGKEVLSYAVVRDGEIEHLVLRRVPFVVSARGVEAIFQQLSR